MRVVVDFGHGILMPNIVEIDLTRDCNLKCYNCNRRCRQYPGKEEITTEAVNKFLAECYNDNEFVWDKIRLMGGEPSLFSHLEEFINVLEEYHKRGCEVEIWTNGFKDSLKLLKFVPSWVKISSGKKLSPAIYYHLKCDMAPLDYGIEIGIDDECNSKKSFSKFAKIDKNMDIVCGFVYTSGGYYVCGGASAIDFIFNLGLGYSSLKEIMEDKGKKQYETLCQYCSESDKMQRYILDNGLQDIQASKTWEDKFKERK